MDPRSLDRQIARIAPAERIRELEHENRALREMLKRAARSIAAHELAAVAPRTVDANLQDARDRLGAALLIEGSDTGTHPGVRSHVLASLVQLQAAIELGQAPADV